MSPGPESAAALDVAVAGRRLRLLFVCTGLSTGGAEMMLLKLVGALSARGFDSAVVSLRDQGTIGPRIAALGVPVGTLELHRFWRLPFNLPRTAWLLRQHRPDLLIGWMYHGNLGATLAAGWMRRPKVLWSIRQTLYSLAAERPLTRLVIRLGTRFASNPAAIIYNSALSAKQHRAIGYRARGEFVLPNGFDCGIFCPRQGAGDSLRRRLHVLEGRPMIGLVARYHPMKDHAMFLRMAGRLVASGSDAHFICAGQGVDARNVELAAGIAANGLAGRVHLLGEQSEPAALLAGLDLLCSSSRSGEGFSNVLGEAMACGVPCIVTDVGESAAIVGDSGAVVPAGDDRAMAEACAHLLAEPPAERAVRAAAARRRIVEHFSLDAVATRYAELFREILGFSPVPTR